MTTNYKQQLLQKISEKKVCIGIVGLGYVGMPLVLRYTGLGCAVVGIDVDKTKIEKLNQGKSYISNIPDASIKDLLQRNFKATEDFAIATEVDALIICVPTPLNKYREPDLSYVEATINSLLPYLRKGQVLSLESTTYPGTTDEIIFPKIKSTGLDVGNDFFLVYSPEREDPGNSKYSTHNIPKICSGFTKNCLEIGKALYEIAVEKVVTVSSTKTAEMTKLLENIHRAVNIGLINEMKVVADKMNIDIYEVIDAAATKPFGFIPYYPGPGLGGHCIPIDPFYLTWKAREYGLHTKFIELAGEINASMPQWVVSKTDDALNKNGKTIKGSKFLIVGLAYKENIGDIRESPSIIIMELLMAKEAEIFYSDPYVPIFPRMREHFFDLKNTIVTVETLESMDCVIIATAHKGVDYEMIRLHSKLIIDTRGVYKEKYPNVIRA